MSWYPRRPDATQELGTLSGSGRVDQGFIAHVTGSPALGTAVAVHAAVTLADGETTEVTTGFTQPDMPRIVTIKGNQASQAGNVVIEGTNVANEDITETIALDEANEVLGTKAFKTVTKVTLPARTTAGDTVSIGAGDKLGLYHPLSHDTVLAAYLDNTKEGTAPTVTADADEVEKNVALLDSALDGSAVDIYYIA